MVEKNNLFNQENNKSIINNAFKKNVFNDTDISAIKSTLEALNDGIIRVSQQNNKFKWNTNEWIKKAILLYFKTQKMKKIECGPFEYYDKIDLKRDFHKQRIRVVPQAIARYGSFINKNVVLMPSYINIGAYIDTGSMIDTWATIGSCAQIGKNVHISGGVGIGGVLEPVQADPVIIEDNCFIGSRSIIVEGVKVKKEAVLGAGVILTKSTKIIDVSGIRETHYQSEVPERSVVIPGSYEKTFPSGKYNVPCALIIGKRKESTDKKTTLNQALREFKIST